MSRLFALVFQSGIWCSAVITLDHDRVYIRRLEVVVLVNLLPFVPAARAMTKFAALIRLNAYAHRVLVCSCSLMGSAPGVRLALQECGQAHVSCSQHSSGQHIRTLIYATSFSFCIASYRTAAFVHAVGDSSTLHINGATQSEGWLHQALEFNSKSVFLYI